MHVARRVTCLYERNENKITHFCILNHIVLAIFTGSFVLATTLYGIRFLSNLLLNSIAMSKRMTNILPKAKEKPIQRETEKKTHSN